jgi:hypothetical protein
MANPRDRFTTASAAPENAAANYNSDLTSVEDVGQKIYRQDRGTGRLTAHIQAIRLVDSVQQ